MMRLKDLDSAQRAREWYHGLTLLPGAWAIVRVDGRSFSRLTSERYDKPFDERFSAVMVTAAENLLTELGGVYAYTESDEISVALDPHWALFGRSVEKLVSISAGVASAAFTLAAGVAGVFDSRVWLGTGVGDVVDYFSWRQADAARCALNGWCYWTLRGEGLSARAATKRLDGLDVSGKNELLYARGVNFNEVPAWQRRGVGLWFEEFGHDGFDPVRQETVTTTRRRVVVNRDLPMGEEYRALVSGRAPA
ncbi:tRNA(His) guanylyltransferase Thg1 family protein [Virgisporangium aurantiacum]|nr:tRNA(His) guanylyltransferase Thg1 family protein [Virgisporangium aurantiacum]